MAFGRQKVRRDPKDFAEKSANLPENETLSAHLKNNFPFLFVVTASAVRTTKVVTTNLFVDAYLVASRFQLSVLENGWLVVSVLSSMKLLSNAYLVVWADLPNRPT